MLAVLGCPGIVAVDDLVCDDFNATERIVIPIMRTFYGCYPSTE